MIKSKLIDTCSKFKIKYAPVLFLRIMYSVCGVLFCSGVQDYKMTDLGTTSLPADNVSSTTYMRSRPVDLPLDMSFMNLSTIEGKTNCMLARLQLILNLN